MRDLAVQIDRALHDIATPLLRKPVGNLGGKLPERGNAHQHSRTHFNVD